MTEKEDLIRVKQDIQLFLRMAAAHFPYPRDKQMLDQLMRLAEDYGNGKDIMKK